MKLLTSQEIRDLVEKAFDAGFAYGNCANEDQKPKIETINELLTEIGEPTTGST